MALEFCETTAALAFRRDYNFAFNRVYWHAHQISEKFYPHHFFGAGGIRIEKFSWYWKIVRADRDISSLTPILSVLALAGLFVAPHGEIYTRLSLVARCDDSLHHCRGLWQSSSVVSASARADHCRFCRRSLRIYRIEDL